MSAVSALWASREGPAAEQIAALLAAVAKGHNREECLARIRSVLAERAPLDDATVAILPAIFETYAEDRLTLQRLSHDLRRRGLSAGEERLARPEFGFLRGALLFMSGDRKAGLRAIVQFADSNPNWTVARWAESLRTSRDGPPPEQIAFHLRARSQGVNPDTTLDGVRNALLASEPLDRALLPPVFAAYADDRLSLQRLSHDLRKRGIHPGETSLATAEFGFVRGVLLFMSGKKPCGLRIVLDFTAANPDHPPARWADALKSSRDGPVAEQIAAFLVARAEGNDNGKALAGIRRALAGSAPLDALTVAVLPAVFNAYAEDRLVLQRLSQDLRRHGLIARSNLLAGPEFNFLRGVLQFFSGDRAAGLRAILGAGKEPTQAEGRLALQRLSDDLRRRSQEAAAEHIAEPELGFLRGVLRLLPRSRVAKLRTAPRRTEGTPGRPIVRWADDLKRSRDGPPAERIAAVLAALARDGNAEAALNGIRSVLAGSTPIDAAVLALLPVVFDAFSSDRRSLQRLSHDLRRCGLAVGSGRLAAHELGFVAGALQYFSGDRTQAAFTIAKYASSLDGPSYERIRAAALALICLDLLPSARKRAELRSLSRQLDAAPASGRPAILEAIRNCISTGLFYLSDIGASTFLMVFENFVADPDAIEAIFCSLVTDGAAGLEASEPCSLVVATIEDIRVGRADASRIAHAAVTAPGFASRALFASLLRRFAADDPVVNSHDSYRPDRRPKTAGSFILIVDGKPGLEQLASLGRSDRFDMAISSVALEDSQLAKRHECLVVGNWYLDAGARQFLTAYGVAMDIARETTSSFAPDKVVTDPLAIAVADANSPRAFLLDRLIVAMRHGPVDRIVVATSGRSLVDAVVKAAEFARCSAMVQWLRPEVTDKAVTQRSKWRKLVRAASAAIRQMQNRQEIDARTVDFLKSAASPVVLAGSISNQPHLAALINAVRAARRRHEVLLFLVGAPKSPNYQTLVDAFKVRKRGDRSVRIIILNDLVTIFRHFPAELSSAGNHCRRRSPADEHSHEDILRAALVCLLSAEINSFGWLVAFLRHMQEAMRTFCAARQIAFSINLSGRTYIGTALNLLLAEARVLTCDAYLYTVANSARQLPSVAQYLSVIDSVQHRFIVESWNFPAERVIRGGYLWDNRRAVATKVRRPEPAGKGHARTVLVATQSGMVDSNLDMLRCLAGAVRDDDTEIIIRVHPSEPATNADIYRACLAENGIPVDRQPQPELSLDAALAAADIVLTQTSNVALQAAARGKAVVKYLAASSQISRTVVDTPYSYNLFDDQTASADIRKILSDAPTRNLLRQQQRRYFRDNPALAKGDGISRILQTLRFQVRQGE